jgi:hypothetical protein
MHDMRLRRRLVTATFAFVLMWCAVTAQTGRAPAPSQRAPVDDMSAVYEVGTLSCGVWLDARDSAKSNPRDVRHWQFESFMLGFASAYNWYVGDARSPQGVLGESDRFAERAYLDKFCRENPSKAFVYAVIDLLNHLKSTQR